MAIRYNTLMTSHKWHVYVLKLQKNKWYVGITTKSPEQELALHKSGKGSAWTKQHKPISLHFTREMGELATDRAEMVLDRAVRKYVDQHGVDNVRGGYLDGLTTTTEKKSRRIKVGSEGQVIIFAFIEAIVIVVLLVQRLPK